MEDTAAFKFDSLPGYTFVITRYTKPTSDAYGTHSEGDLRTDYHRDGEQFGGGTVEGPTAPEQTDRTFVPGGKASFLFRSLPGYTFWATRSVRDVTLRDEARGETATALEGWIRIGYTRDHDEEHELFGMAGPQINPR
jgi:hypothetical protein